jgi:predicted ester cyclase
MSDQNAKLAVRWFEEVWNENREQTIDELLAPDVVIHGLGEDGQPGVGREEFRRFYRLFRAGLTDIRITVEGVLAHGDETAVRLTLTGRHAGDGFGVRSTGRAILVTGIVWGRWRNGQLVEAWNEFDAAGLMKQIGGADAAPVAVKA